MIPIRMGPAKKASKYKNIKVELDGLKFDSKREAARWGQLRMLERLGQITLLRRQVAYDLAPSVRLAGEARAKPALRLVVDFEYVEQGVKIVEDVKSPATATKEAFRIKQHLLLSVHGLQIRIVK